MAVNYLKQHLTFKGRIGRLEYFIATCLAFFGIFALAGLTHRLLPILFPSLVETSNPIGVIIFFAGFLLLGSMNFTATVRRLHDMDHSGWKTLLFYIPIIGWLWYLALFFKKGTEGPNQYGPPPDGSERPVHSAE